MFILLMLSSLTSRAIRVFYCLLMIHSLLFNFAGEECSKPAVINVRETRWQVSVCDKPHSRLDDCLITTGKPFQGDGLPHGPSRCFPCSRTQESAPRGASQCLRGYCRCRALFGKFYVSKITQLFSQGK